MCRKQENEKRRIVRRLTGVISSDSGTNGLSVARQTGTNGEDLSV